MDVSCHRFVPFLCNDTERPCPHDKSLNEFQEDRILGTQAGRSVSSRFHIYEISPNELIDTVSCPGWIEIQCPF